MLIKKGKENENENVIEGEGEEEIMEMGVERSAEKMKAVF